MLIKKSVQFSSVQVPARLERDCPERGHSMVEGGHI